MHEVKAPSRSVSDIIVERALTGTLGRVAQFSTLQHEGANQEEGEGEEGEQDIKPM